MGYSVILVLSFVGVSRSTYYYNIKNAGKHKEYKGGRPVSGYSLNTDGNPICDDQIKRYILSLIEGEGECYGYSKLTVVLRRKFNLVINRKKVYRLCKELSILRPQRKLQPRFPRKIAVNREVTKINALWEVDIKYGYIEGEKRFFYVLSYIDIYDRSIVGYYIGLNCCSADAARTLRRAIIKRDILLNNTHLVIRSDNGPQFVSYTFEKEILDMGLEHERIPCQTPNKNAHIESYHRIVQDELFSRCEFRSYAEAYAAVEKFVGFYNNTRIHGAIGYISPKEYYTQALSGSEKKQTIRL